MSNLCTFITSLHLICFLNSLFKYSKLQCWSIPSWIPIVFSSGTASWQDPRDTCWKQRQEWTRRWKWPPEAGFAGNRRRRLWIHRCRLNSTCTCRSLGTDTRTLTTSFGSDFPSIASIHSCKTEKIDWPP